MVEREDTGSPGNVKQYLHRDNQGSVTKVTDASGNVDQAMAFDAWGLRRDPTDWSALASPFAGSNETERGYTGHEHLDTVGLIHMNGRVQDPVLGRFISADPLIQAPYNTQSHNRYSYVWNNPTSFTDPSGFQCIDNVGPCDDDSYEGADTVVASASRQCDNPMCFIYRRVGVGEGYIDFQFTFHRQILEDEWQHFLFANTERNGINASTVNAGRTGAGIPDGGDDTPSEAMPIAAAAGTAVASAGEAVSTGGRVIGGRAIGAAIAGPLGAATLVLTPSSLADGTVTASSRPWNGRYNHYTNEVGRAGILASGFILPSSDGFVYVTPTVYASGSVAQAELSLSTTPTGFFSIPGESVRSLVPGNTSVDPHNGQPGGGIEWRVPHPVPAAGAVWVPIAP